jgi:hypothetical protein
VSNSGEPTDQKEDETSESPMVGEDLSERPKARTIGLLSLFGLAASAAGLSTDVSFSDIVSTIASRGLAASGVLATVVAATIVFRRLTAGAARAETLREVQQEIDNHVKAEETRQDVDPRVLSEVINELVRLRQDLDKRGRNGTRIGWFQGAVFAALTTAVTVLLIVFSRFIPVIK